MSSNRILLFDLDGTLVDSAQTIAAALSRLRTQRGGDAVDVASVRRWVSLGVDRLVSNALGEFAARSDEDVAAFRAILVTIPTKTEALFADVAAVLLALRAHYEALGIVTNKPETLAKALLADVGLLTLFDVVVGGETAGISKPHRAPLDYALSALGGHAEQAIFIGDSDIDAAAAANADLPFVFFEGGYGPVPRDGVVIAGRFAAFAQLPGALAGI